MIQKLIFLTLSVVFISACGLATTRPKLEMSYAQAAFLAAKQAKADVYSSNLFRKAEIYYLKAKSAYRRKYFNKAKSYAKLCKRFAEEAEYEAIKKTVLDSDE
jgi:hypothetical protein